MIKYFIRTTGERTLDKSYNQIDYELLIDNQHNCGKAFLEQLKQVNEFDAVLIEDDCILCENFKDRIEKVISQHPSEIINFFSNPYQWQKCGYRKIFSYNQCTYFPKGSANKIISLIIDNNFSSNSAEKIMNYFMLKSNSKYWLEFPYLVQHIDNNSLMGHNCPEGVPPRRSPYFIDYLKELNISVEESKLMENQKNLLNLMNNKFKNI